MDVLRGNAHAPTIRPTLGDSSRLDDTAGHGGDEAGPSLLFFVYHATGSVALSSLEGQDGRQYRGQDVLFRLISENRETGVRHLMAMNPTGWRRQAAEPPGTPELRPRLSTRCMRPDGPPARPPADCDRIRVRTVGHRPARGCVSEGSVRWTAWGGGVELVKVRRRNSRWGQRGPCWTVAASRRTVAWPGIG